jgi:hypothetical protein
MFREFLKYNVFVKVHDMFWWPKCRGSPVDEGLPGSPARGGENAGSKGIMRDRVGGGDEKVGGDRGGRSVKYRKCRKEMDEGLS